MVTLHQVHPQGIGHIQCDIRSYKRIPVPVSSGDQGILAADTMAEIMDEDTAGIMITRPLISSGFNVRARFETAICPSYSSPWLPPVSRAQGPSPLRTTLMGIMIDPETGAVTGVADSRSFDGAAARPH